MNTNRVGARRRGLRRIACGFALLLLGCGGGDAGMSAADQAYFRFTLDGQEHEADGPRLTLSPLDDGRYLFGLDSERSGGGPRVSGLWRVPLSDPSALAGLEVTGRDLRADPSAAFTLFTGGEAGATTTPASNLSLRFSALEDGFVEGSFTASGLEFAESYAAPPGEARTVDASGTFRMPVAGL